MISDQYDAYTRLEERAKAAEATNRTLSENLLTLKARVAELEAALARVRQVMRDGSLTYSRLHAALSPAPAAQCPERESGGVQCELPAGHTEPHACPEHLKNYTPSAVICAFLDSQGRL